MAFTRTPRPAHSTASTLVSPTTAPLLAPYGARPGIPTSAPMIDATLTMQPCPASSIRAPNARQQRKTPVMLTSITLAQSSSEYVSDGAILLTPALFTRIVASPSRSATATAAASTDAVEETSSAKPA